MAMKCILMNKDVEVMSLEYDSISCSFTKIYNVSNMEYAPYIISRISNDNDALLKRVSRWFLGRGIPSWRDRLDLLLHRLNIIAPNELLNKAFGLSLSDQYWLKPFDTNIKYDDINFFDNDFDYSEFLEASLSKNSSTIINENSLKTPNNTTDGMLKKAWVIEDGIRYLLKSGYKTEVLQPFNEVLASEICKRLGFNHVTYTLDLYKNTVVSKCPCFINKDIELVTAYQVVSDIWDFNVDSYEKYISKLEEMGINDARREVENMFILDFLIMNEDRHLNNFGIIRAVDTLKWVCVAPIFDNGQSLNINYYSEDELHVSGEGRFFYEVRSFDEIIKVVKDIKRIDVSKLEGIPEWFDNLLHQYQEFTHISNERINKLCILLNHQINKLKKLIEE
jgi:hypothetical protein